MKNWLQRRAAPEKSEPTVEKFVRVSWTLDRGTQEILILKVKVTDEAAFDEALRQSPIAENLFFFCDEARGALSGVIHFSILAQPKVSTFSRRVSIGSRARVLRSETRESVSLEKLAANLGASRQSIGRKAA